MANRNGWTLALAWTLGVLINVFAWPFAQMLMFGMTEDTPVTIGTVVAGLVALAAANVPFVLLLVVLNGDEPSWRKIGWGLAVTYVVSLVAFASNLIGFGMPLGLIALSSFGLSLWVVQWREQKSKT